MTKLSAGILVHRRSPDVEVLLVHPGGPFWAKKDEHAWSIPKGELEPGEVPIEVAQREFVEELGQTTPAGDLIALGEFEQNRQKRIVIWTVEADLDVAEVRSNTFTMEWPPKSGRHQEFPEVDRAEWFDLDTARTKLVKGQVQVLDALLEHLGT